MRRFNMSKSPLKRDIGKNSDGLWLQNPRARFPKRDRGSPAFCLMRSHKSQDRNFCVLPILQNKRHPHTPAANATTAPKAKSNTDARQIRKLLACHIKDQ